MHMVIAAARQPVTHSQPSDAFIVGIHTHSRQIVTDDIFPLLIGMNPLPCFNRQRAMPYPIHAFTTIRIPRATTVAWHRLPRSGTLHVSSIEPPANLCIRFTWMPIKIECIQQVAARAHHMLIRMLIEPTRAEQVTDEPRRIGTATDFRNHIRSIGMSDI